MVKYITLSNINFQDLRAIFANDREMYHDCKVNAVTHLNRFIRQYQVNPQEILIKKEVPLNDYFESKGQDRLLFGLNENITTETDLTVYGSNNKEKDFLIKTVHLDAVTTQEEFNFNVGCQIYNYYKIVVNETVDIEAFITGSEIFDLAYNVFLYTAIKQGVVQDGDFWHNRLQMILNDIDTILKAPFINDFDTGEESNEYFIAELRIER